MPRTAVVLSGGEGIRLRPITADLPKGLVKVGGKPLPQWVVEWLKANGVTNIVIGERRHEHCNRRGLPKRTDNRLLRRRDTFWRGNPVQHPHSSGRHKRRLQAGSKRYVEDQTFFALNGDQITDLTLKTMLAKHQKSETLSTIAVVHPRLPFGLVKVDKNDYCR